MRARPSLLLVLLTLVLAACGDDDSGGGDGGGSAGAGLADKSAEQILADVARELRGVKSYHVDATQTDDGGRLRLTGDVSASGASQMRFQQAGQRFEVRLVRDTTYLKADAGFWRSQGGSAQGDQIARLFGDKWVKATSDDFGLRRAFDQLLPSTLAACLTRDHGKITKKGEGEVGGTKTIVLHDDGKNPGGAPGDLHIAAEGRPLPLRIVQTGPETPGKSKDPRCGGDDSTTKDSDVRLTDFDAPVDVRAPKDAVDLGALARQGAEEQTN